MPLTLSAASGEGAPPHRATLATIPYQAVLLRADGVPVATIAQTLTCPETSVHNWVGAWRAEGLAGVAEGIHPGKARRLDAAAEAALQLLLTEGDPQAHGDAATGWTVPLLRTERARR